jgi:hypothetical protein
MINMMYNEQWSNQYKIKINTDHKKCVDNETYSIENGKVVKHASRMKHATAVQLEYLIWRHLSVDGKIALKWT